MDVVDVHDPVEAAAICAQMVLTFGKLSRLAAIDRLCSQGRSAEVPDAAWAGNG